MTNLIPQKGKKLVKREYILRVLAVWMLLFSGVLIALTFLLLPTYVLLTGRLQALSLQYNELIAGDVSQYQDAREAVEAANVLATQLQGGGENVLPYEIATRINDALSNDITLLGLSYAGGAGGPDVRIQGIAATRGALVTFIDRLKADPLFTEATIPVSDLARETSLTFSAVLTIEEQ